VKELKEIAYDFLRLNQIKISKLFLKKRLESHPDYPALIAYTDTLEELNLEYSAFQVEKEMIEELSYPILIHSKEGNQEGFTIVQSLKAFQANESKLISNWDGVTLMVEKGAVPKNSEYAQFIGKEKQNSFTQTAFISLIGILFLGISYSNFSLFPFILSFLSLLGIITCGLIIQYTLGIDNSLTEKLCDSSSEQGCEKILHSKAGKI
jgi:hypothetical protein